MAQRVKHLIFGVDVSKDTLEVFEWDRERGESIANEKAAIRAWLAKQTMPLRLAVEATNCYHMDLVEAAHAQGHEVYLVDAYRLRHYRESVGTRAKTDRLDAWLLARYLANEAAVLRAWKPLRAGEKRLWALLQRRAKLVSNRVQLRQSLADVPELDLEDVLSGLQRAIRRIDTAMRKLVRELGWHDEVRRCQALPGVGALNATALVAAYHRGTFPTADTFIAFLGLDVRVRQSGKFEGQRKLTKKGEPELRRLLYNAAMAGRRHALWQPYYQALRDRGMSGTAALVALGRKLARIAFALLRSGAEFNPQHRQGACATT